VPARRHFALGCAFVLAVAIAFLAGMAVADRAHNAPGSAASAQGDAEFRNVFSPVIRKDPYFRRKQRENVEALEAYCRQSGKMCGEARAARKTFDADG
jgi:hypothetical protein